jgi:phenylpyruvate tautomerase PptA (4-oxalocrotonate tautomerase family)
MLKLQAVIDVVHVPYKGPAAAITDLLAGQMQICFETGPVILPHAEAGKLKVIAVANDSRFAQLPAVPTTRESGFPNLTGGFWSGILAPTGTSPIIIDQLNAAINEAMQLPDAQLGLAKLGGEARLGSPQDFGAFISAETQKWSAIIRAAGITMNWGIQRKSQTDLRGATMPYLQLDVPHHYSAEVKRALAKRLSLLFADIMQTTPDNVAVAFSELGEGGLWRCGGDEPESAAAITCDIRRGRTPEQRARLAEALIAACAEALELRETQLSVGFTQHAGDEAFRPGRGLFSDWTASESNNPATPHVRA